MFDIVSYVMGQRNGRDEVIIEEGGDYTFTDANSDGNIVIEEADNE